ncbi:MAG: hypothetical protein EB117_14945 [Betaproteobacteria bacterium]|nr:hypothetical protein [Betaproteobacteria bacterium]
MLRRCASLYLLRLSQRRSRSLSGLIGGDHLRRVRGGANGLHAGILVAVVIARGNDMAVERAANLLAIFHDGGLCAYLYTAVFNYFNQIYFDYFFKGHFDTPIKN